MPHLTEESVRSESEKAPESWETLGLQARPFPISRRHVYILSLREHYKAGRLFGSVCDLFEQAETSEQAYALVKLSQKKRVHAQYHERNQRSDSQKTPEKWETLEICLWALRGRRLSRTMHLQEQCIPNPQRGASMPHLTEESARSEYKMTSKRRVHATSHGRKCTFWI